MSRASVYLLPPSLEPAIDRTGDKLPAAGCYGHTTGLHTIAIKLLNFQGRIHIEGALTLDPQEADWFTLIVANGLPYLDFPNPQTPATAYFRGASGIVGQTFSCNCLWIRARIERSHLIPANATDPVISQFGSVDSILGNFACGFPHDSVRG